MLQFLKVKVNLVSIVKKLVSININLVSKMLRYLLEINAYQKI